MKGTGRDEGTMDGTDELEIVEDDDVKAITPPFHAAALRVDPDEKRPNESSELFHHNVEAPPGPWLQHPSQLVAHVEGESDPELVERQAEDLQHPTPDAAVIRRNPRNPVEIYANHGVQANPSPLAGDASPSRVEGGADQPPSAALDAPGADRQPNLQRRDWPQTAPGPVWVFPSNRLPQPVPPRDPSEPDEPPAPIIEGRLVDDESERPIYDAVPLVHVPAEDEGWVKEHRKQIILGLIFILVALAVAFGMLFAFHDGNGARLISPPTTSTSPSTIFYPTIGSSMAPPSPPSSSASPSITFSPSKTVAPSFQPTDSSKPTPKTCFLEKAELQAAISNYVAQGCGGDSGCEVAELYGWPMNSWCVSLVADFSYLFRGMSEFNEDISGWNTHSATEMHGTFLDASSFNGDLSVWNTSKVIDLQGMFNHASSFNGDLSGWDTSSVESAILMFNHASSFNGDLSGWNTASMIEMRGMFWGASSFNQDLCTWADSFPYGMESNGIFLESNCTFRGNPQPAQGGPFCASECET